MKIYFVRHQAEGVLHAFPFDHQPTQAECDAALAPVNAARGLVFQKTGVAYWAKIIAVENGETTVVGCAHGRTVEEVNAHASGHCPIRAVGLTRAADAADAAPVTGPVSTAGQITVRGSATVKNPES